MRPRIAVLGPIAALALGGCGTHYAEPITNGSILPQHSEAIVEQARVEGEREQARLADERAASAMAALATCAPAICDAIARGELALGMNEAQVLAATRTTAFAWDTRSSGGATSMTHRPGGAAPRDAAGEIAYVGLQNGAVTSYTYREPQGFRTVSTPLDATSEGRAASQADALLRMGDEYAAAGRLDQALLRYDQADVIRPSHPETTLRIASTLDKQLRPIEALLQYKLFLHELELEKIEARGVVAANIAEAIARARERIIVLEQR